MSYLLDTDWAIQALVGRSPAVTLLNRLMTQPVAVSIVSVGELYESAYSSPNPTAHLTTYRQFISVFRIVNLDHGIMERFAEIRALLRRRGELIPDFDLLIAATALRHDLIVLTFNVRHLQRIPDLKLYQPG